MKVFTDKQLATVAKAKELLAEGYSKQDAIKKLKMSMYDWNSARQAGHLPMLAKQPKKLSTDQPSVEPKKPRRPKTAKARLVNVAVVDESPALSDGHVTVVLIKTPVSQLASVLNQI